MNTRQSWILDSTPWIPDSRYWIPVFVSGTLIPDSKRYWDSRFHRQKYPGFRNFWLKMKNGSVCHRMLTCPYYNNGIVHPCKSLEHFNMTSRSPYWCTKTIKRWPCWCSKPILWGLNIFLMWKRSFVAINLHRCWPHTKEDLSRVVSGL